MTFLEQFFGLKPRMAEASFNKIFDVDTAIIGQRNVAKAMAYAEGKSDLEIITDAKAGNTDAVNFIFHRMGGIIYKGFQLYTGTSFRGDKEEAYLEYASEAYLLLKSGSTYTTGSPLETFDPSKYDKLGTKLLDNFAYYYKQYLKMMIRNWHAESNRKGLTGNGAGDAKFSSIDYMNDADDSDHAGNNKYADYVTDEYNKYHGIKSMEDEVTDRVDGEIASSELVAKFSDCAADPAWDKSHGVLRKLVKALIRNPNAADFNEVIYEAGLISDEEIDQYIADQAAKGRKVTRNNAIHTKYLTASKNLTEKLPALLSEYDITMNEFGSALTGPEGKAIYKLLK